MYSEQELKAKQTSKNIKGTIIRTRWSFSMFETSIGVSFGHRNLTVPKPIMSQITTFWSLKSGEKSPSEALKEIKDIGQTEAKNNKSTAMSAYHYFMGKTETEKYFGKFLDEESFNNAFTKKS